MLSPTPSQRRTGSSAPHAERAAAAGSARSSATRHAPACVHAAAASLVAQRQEASARQRLGSRVQRFAVAQLACNIDANRRRTEPSRPSVFKPRRFMGL
jgi:hypothetical protein